MKVRIEYTDEAGETTLENIRYSDEIGEAFCMSDEQADEMDRELRNPGRYWIDAQRCAYAQKC